MLSSDLLPIAFNHVVARRFRFVFCHAARMKLMLDVVEHLRIAAHHYRTIVGNVPDSMAVVMRPEIAPSTDCRDMTGMN